MHVLCFTVTEGTRSNWPERLVHGLNLCAPPKRTGRHLGLGFFNSHLKKIQLNKLWVDGAGVLNLSEKEHVCNCTRKWRDCRRKWSTPNIYRWTATPDWFPLLSWEWGVIIIFLLTLFPPSVLIGFHFSTAYWHPVPRNALFLWQGNPLGAGFSSFWKITASATEGRWGYALCSSDAVLCPAFSQ